MEIDYCLILSAGFGTRMGKVGKVLPKVLWPLFEKTLLEAQYHWVRELGCKSIFVNTHYLHEKINSYIDSNKNLDINVLHEKELLNTGGAIHNLKNRYNIKKGKLLVIAGDQFYFFPNSEWEKAIKKIEKAHSVLFGLKTNGRTDSYNELVLDKGLLKSIVPYKKESHFNRDYVTYSGLGLVNMELLENKNGKSSFFETVANYSESKVEVIIPEVEEYWDFGSNKRYYENIYSILGDFLEHNNGQLLQFCFRNKIFTPDKVCEELRSYGPSEGLETINLSGGPLLDDKKSYSVILKGGDQVKKRGGIIYENLFDNIRN